MKKAYESGAHKRKKNAEREIENKKQRNSLLTFLVKGKDASSSSSSSVQYTENSLENNEDLDNHQSLDEKHQTLDVNQQIMEERHQNVDENQQILEENHQILVEKHQTLDVNQQIMEERHQNMDENHQILVENLKNMDKNQQIIDKDDIMDENQINQSETINLAPGILTNIHETQQISPVRPVNNNIYNDIALWPNNITNELIELCILKKPQNVGDKKL